MRFWRSEFFRKHSLTLLPKALILLVGFTLRAQTLALELSTWAEMR